MRIAVIGLGDIAQKAYLPLLASWEGIELFLCSRSPATVERLQRQYRVLSGTTNLSDVPKWNPDAAFVLTPSPTHVAAARFLLEAGIDVFLEKPATLHSQETLEIAQLADSQERILMVGFNRRFAPLHQQAKALWQERPIGFCVLEKHRATAAHPDLFSNYLDDTIHIIDLLRFFCGEGEALFTVQQVREGRLVGAVSLIALHGGGYGLVVTSLQAGGWREQYALHGSGRSLYLDAFSRLRLVSDGSEQVWELGSGEWRPMLEARGFVSQIAHFLTCVRHRQSPLTSAWEAYRTQSLLEEMVARRKE